MLSKKINYHIYNRFIILKTLGYTVKDIGKILNISYQKSQKYNFHYNTINLMKNKAYIGSKEEPYYHNEWKYSSLPTYKFDELSDREKQFYFENLKKGN